MNGGTPWWDADRHTDRRPFLLARNRVKAVLRAWFEGQGFVEVEPSILQASPGNEAHLHALRAELHDVDGSWLARRYLHTSPEFACKKLLAAGEERLFTFAPVFRDRERGALHGHEFTMLEWYRADEPYTALMEDCAALLRMACEAAGSGVLTWQGRTCDPLQEPERLTVAEAFERYAGLDLPGTFTGRGEPDRDALAQAVSGSFVQNQVLRGFEASADDSWSDIFSKILAAFVEPNLGVGRPTVLYEYPLCEAALARPKPANVEESRTNPSGLSRHAVAERFELYACGVELANAFGELTDSSEQRRRFEADMDLKERLYGERYPLDEGFLAALETMPEASGAALGFERLVMLATGAPTIDHVRWTPR